MSDRALDDFVPGSEHEQLLPVAAYVKTDFIGLDAAGRAVRWATETVRRIGD